MDKIAILIPCFNESATIQKVVQDFIKILPDHSHVYVYDNNSTDGTDVLAREAGAVVRYERLQGKGNVVRRMFREIDAECYVLADGDDTYPAEAAPEMIDKVLSQQCDMVVGDRLTSTYFNENKRPFHNFGNRIVRWSINTLFGSDIRDIMTGYRCFSYYFVKSFPVLSKGFEIETEMSIHAIDKNLAVENVIVDYRDRPIGSESKLNTISDGGKVLRTIWKLFRTYKPLTFYGIIAAILLCVAAILFLPIGIEYIRTGLVPKFPTLIVSGFIVVAAIHSFFSGMILETIQQKNRQDFELRLIDIQKRLDDMRNSTKGKA